MIFITRWAVLMKARNRKKRAIPNTSNPLRSWQFSSKEPVQSFIITIRNRIDCIPGAGLEKTVCSGKGEAMLRFIAFGEAHLDDEIGLILLYPCQICWCLILMILTQAQQDHCLYLVALGHQDLAMKRKLQNAERGTDHVDV